jgi:hypothetical protein
MVSKYEYELWIGSSGEDGLSIPLTEYTGIQLEGLKKTAKKFRAAGGLNKVKLSVCLTKYHAMKAYWGVEV